MVDSTSSSYRDKAKRPKVKGKIKRCTKFFNLHIFRIFVCKSRFFCPMWGRWRRQRRRRRSCKRKFISYQKEITLWPDFQNFVQKLQGTSKLVKIIFKYRGDHSSCRGFFLEIPDAFVIASNIRNFYFLNLWPFCLYKLSNVKTSPISKQISVTKIQIFKLGKRKGSYDWGYDKCI